LPAELQQRLEVWTTQAYTDDNVFLTLACSPGVLELFVHWAAFMDTGVSCLEPSTMERCRLRLAARHHCVHGSLARSASLMRQGFSEVQVEAALGDLDHADVPAKTVAALRLVDLLRAPHPVIDTATSQQLRAHLDDRERLELGAALSVASGWQRVTEAFGIRLDRWTEALPLPWQEGAL
jgi:alkylhydroperoxidase family enzyme